MTTDPRTDLPVAHEEGCPIAASTVPARLCKPCHWIRFGKALGYRLARDEQDRQAVARDCTHPHSEDS